MQLGTIGILHRHHDEFTILKPELNNGYQKLLYRPRMQLSQQLAAYFMGGAWTLTSGDI